MTKRIFRSILLVSVLVFLVGVTFMIGILYQHFGQQLEKELQNELTYLSIAVENDGTSVLENLPEQAERITLVAADGTVLFDNRANASEYTPALPIHMKIIHAFFCVSATADFFHLTVMITKHGHEGLKRAAMQQILLMPIA